MQNATAEEVWILYPFCENGHVRFPYLCLGQFFKLLDDKEKEKFTTLVFEKLIGNISILDECGIPQKINLDE